MKHTQSLSLYIALMTILSLSSCLDDDASQIIDNTPTTFQIIASSDVHNTLEELLLTTSLDAVLDSGIYTVFAPTDEAFEAIDLSGLSDDEITQVLLNHVLVGSAEASDLSNGYISTNATENITGHQSPINLHVNVDGGITLNGVSTVSQDNINASNGVIHYVDAVIPIPDITTFVTADPRLNTLLEALTRDDQPDFISILSSYENSAPFTVFGPTNDAFSELLTNLELTELSEIEGSLLTSTLNTHVITEENLREENFMSGSLNTLGDPFEIDPNLNTITDINGNEINIIITNIQAGNGVIHLIDNVILPELPE